MAIAFIVIKKILFYRNRTIFEDKIRNKINMTYRPYSSGFINFRHLENHNIEIKNLKLKYQKCWKYTSDERICNIIYKIINRLDYTSKRRKITHNFMKN